MERKELPSNPGKDTLRSEGLAVRAGQWLALPHISEESPHTSTLPVLDLSPSDLEQRECWSLILRLVDRNIPLLARLSRSLPFQEDGLIQALGWKVHYRSKEEWEQWARLDALSEELFMRFDFPLSILRLWDRWEERHRRDWFDLWIARGFKKNLIREIILYFHDLHPDVRQEAIEDALIFSHNWKARSGNFPAEQVRDMIYRKRYPEISQLKEQAFRIQKGLPPDRRLDVQVPDHLEAGFLDLRIRIFQVQDLEEVWMQLGTEENRQRIQQLLDIVR